MTSSGAALSAVAAAYRAAASALRPSWRSSTRAARRSSSTRRSSVVAVRGGAVKPARQGGRIAPQLRELPQAILDLAILGNQRDQGHVLGQRARDVAERAQPLATLAPQRLQALPLRETDRHGQQLGHVGRAPGGLEAAAQRIQRLQAHLGRRLLVDEDPLQPLGQGRRSVGVIDQRAQHLEGGVRLTELGVQRGREAQALLARLRARQPLEPDAPDRAELAEPPIALEEALERGRHLGVLRTHPEQPIEVADGARTLAGEVLGDARRLRQQLGAPLVAARRRQARVVGVEDVGPALGHRERDDQRAKRPVGVGRRRQDGAQHLDRLGRVLAEAIRREPDRPVREHLMQRPGELRRELGPVDVQQSARLPLVRGDRLFEAPPRRVVARLAERVVQRLVEGLG